MPAAVPLHAPRTDPPRKRFTRQDVDRMQSAGLFTGLRCELIQGDLIDKMSQNPPHANCVRLLNALLAEIHGAKRVQSQLPIEVAAADQQWSLPEPDLAVLTPSHTPAEARFQKRHPRGDETTLVVEVADSSLQHDLTVKRDLYARAGVPEYWALDVASRRLILHRQSNAGAYSSILTLTGQDSAGPFPVSALFP